MPFLGHFSCNSSNFLCRYESWLGHPGVSPKIRSTSLEVLWIILLLSLPELESLPPIFILSFAWCVRRDWHRLFRVLRLPVFTSAK